MKNVTYNLLSKILDSNLKILYSTSGSIFDSIINRIDAYVIYRDSFFADRISYDLLFGNDVMTHCDDKNKLIKYHQINDVLFIHDKFSAAMKKEDKVIIKNNLRSTVKLFASNDVQCSWDSNESSHIIPYGIPASQFNSTKKRKSIVVINTKNNPQIDMLYNQIKNIYSDAEILRLQPTFEDYTNKLNEFKIAIEINSVINLLVAQCCGNFTITSISNSNMGLGIYDIQDWSTIKQPIDEVLNDYDNYNLSKQKELIEKQYLFEIFESNMLQVLSSIKEKPYLI